MILVIGGTKESEKITELLRNKDFGQGVETNLKSAHGEKVSKGVVFLPRYLNCPMTVRLIRRYNVKVLVDATSICFKKASLRAMSACKITGIKYIRFEPPSFRLKESKDVHKVKSLEEASEKAMDFGKAIFLNIGNNNIELFVKKAEEKKKELVVRVSEQGGLNSCLNFGIKHHNILLIEGVFSKAFNRALIKEYNISVCVVRDTGEKEKIMPEIEAALAEKIPVVFIERPRLEYKELITDFDELVKSVKSVV